MSELEARRLQEYQALRHKELAAEAKEKQNAPKKSPPKSPAKKRRKRRGKKDELGGLGAGLSDYAQEQLADLLGHLGR